MEVTQKVSDDIQTLCTEVLGYIPKSENLTENKDGSTFIKKDYKAYSCIQHMMIQHLMHVPKGILFNHQVTNPDLENLLHSCISFSESLAPEKIQEASSD